MAMRPGPRHPVGSAAWVTEERSSALDISQSEVEEFAFSARNETEWLNEHMAGIFSENQINVAEIFKTPGKLRGKTPRTARRVNQNETRAPLSDIFSSTPKSTPNPFATTVLDRAQPSNLKIAEDKPASPGKPAVLNNKPIVAAQPNPVVDSGYYGSQSQEGPMDVDEMIEDAEPTHFASPQRISNLPQQVDTATADPQATGKPSSTTQSFETLESAKEDQMRTAKIASPTVHPADEPETATVPPSSPVHLLEPTSPEKSPAMSSTTPNTSPTKPSEPSVQQISAHEQTLDLEPAADDGIDVTRSPSDGSSPIRPIVRKSSLNFASLPAREPLTSNKSLGARMSRTSHLDQTRTSYYNRNTGGKSIGVRHESSEDDQNDMDVDDDDIMMKGDEEERENTIAAHNKTYTQRLQDQISMLGKSQPSGARSSKSIPNLAANQQTPHGSHSQQLQPAPQVLAEKSSSPPKVHQASVTPGAFPQDDEDDWIAPPTVTQKIAPSPRPGMARSYSTDVMDGVHGEETIGSSDFVLPKQRHQESTSRSPQRPAVPERTASVPGHSKSVSVPFVPNRGAFGEGEADDGRLKTAVSVSNPTFPTVQESDLPNPPKLPLRSFRDSPLKHVKSKFSSILKSSKGLLASSAAISAESKAYLVSPSATRVALYPSLSAESLQPNKDAEPLYPDLTKHTYADSQPLASSSSPSRPNRKTRASAERERRDLKQKDKETKEAQRQAEQLNKLDKAREKEREKARIFSKEQDKIAAMENQVTAQREQEKKMRAPAPKDTPKPTRTSPRKVKAQQEAEEQAVAAVQRPIFQDDDVQMIDAASAMPPPTIPRPATDSQAAKGREIRRPIKPSKGESVKYKQAPTLIRVNTSSQHSTSQNPGFHPSNSILAAGLQDTPGGPQHQLKGKASQQSMHNKPSLQSLKSSVSSSGRPKALDLAAKRKEQEEREVQRRREAKAEMERKRAAIQEEERRQEQQRRQEAERQREKVQEQAAARLEAKRHAQRQAVIEKAKQTRAPPPAIRSQPNGPPEYGGAHNNSGVSRPQSRLPSSIHRSQEDLNRPVNAVLSTTTKAPPKRPLQQDGNEDTNQRSTMTRSGPSHPKEAKRMRMTDEFNFDDELEFQPSQSNIKGPPVRPSGGFKKDLPNKPLYGGGGYAPAPQNTTRDLFKATVTAQHNTQTKASRPLDMAQVSKGAIPFAPQSNFPGASHKTPARPMNKTVAKSATRASPRFQNGEAIELPEIDTDDEDDEDEGHIGVAAWADSPDLRRALMQQETMDPLQIFGAPGPLNMEEVFHKSKDRWHKFRARTSSANWSGTDRLTEEDIRKDLAARDKMRREGGWSYELSKDVA